MSDKASKENCSGVYPALFRFAYDFDQKIGRSVEGTGEVEMIGKQRATAYYDVIAPTPELATAAFNNEFGWRFRDEASNYDKHEVKSGPEFVCYVDAIIRVGKP